MLRSTLLAAVLATLVCAAPAAARRPVIGYVNASTGAFSLFDAETGQDLPAPRLDVGGIVKRFAMSLNGRYVVYRDSASRIRLFDRATNVDAYLPGINVTTSPDGLTVSNGGLIGFDDSGDGPTRVYDRVAKAFVDTGLASGNGNRQPRLSGDGRFLVTTCNSGCDPAAVSGSDAYLQDLQTRTPVAFPNDLSGSDQRDEEHPCIDGDGSLVALNISNPAQTDIFMYDRAASASVALPGINDAAKNDFDCVLDSSGRYVGFTAFDRFKLYDRTTGGFVSLPDRVTNTAARPSAASLTDPFTPGQAGPRRPVIAYIDPVTGRFSLWDSQLGRDLGVPPLPTGLSRFSLSLDGRFVVYSDPVDQDIHLYDRFAGGSRALPGIDVYSRPGSLSVSSTGRIAFDDNVNGPTVVYNSATGTFLNTGLSASNGHHMPRLSGDGRFLATTCLDGLNPCVTESGGDSDAYVQDLSTATNLPFPDTLSGASGRDEERPCIDRTGSVVGVDVGRPIQHDVLLYSRSLGQVLLTPGLNVPTTDDLSCKLDSAANFVARSRPDGGVRVYSRAAQGFAALSGKITDPIWLISPNPGKASIAGSKLSFTAGVATPNTVSIVRSGSAFTISDDHAPVTPGTGCTAVTYAKVTCPAAGITSLAISTFDNTDVVTMTGATRMTVDAGAGSDTLTGGSGADTLIGGAGNDTLRGGAGADALRGDVGDDRLLSADGVLDAQLDCGAGAADTATVDPAEVGATVGCESVSTP